MAIAAPGLTMGTWGIGVSSNDTYADVRSEFFELYNGGENVRDISARLTVTFSETLADPDDANNFWFALAKAQWECKEQDPAVLARVEQIVASGDDIEVWRRLDADESSLRKRKQALEKFLEIIRSERARPKPRTKKVIRRPPFAKGDCLTFKLANGNFGGAVVLEALRDTEYGHSLLATTRIDQPNKPTRTDFERAEVLIQNYAAFMDVPSVNWYLPIRHKNVADRIETVERIEVQIGYENQINEFGHIADFDLWVIEVADTQFEWEKTHASSLKRITIKELTKKKRWKFW